MTDNTHSESKGTNEIIIDLFAPNLPGSIKESDLIQKVLRDQLVENIRSSIILSESNNSSGVARFVDESGRNVFFVDGTRGAGKTTFINSVVEHLEKGGSDAGAIIKCLPTIDPTKLPRHEPILVTVTARLNKMVSEKLKESWSSNDHKRHKERWQNHLGQLKRGLHLLTDKEYKPEYFSDAMKLDAQLDYSIGGQDLSEIFDRMVDSACDILGCKAIMISFDDIDTQFDAGWDVLESIRKFFNSQKLVVVATGDLRLYSQLIRGKQYENYSKTLLDQEKENARLAERGYMVEHLEQQYLLKLFPVQKRVQLTTMLQLVGEKGEEGPESIKVKTMPSMQDVNAIGVRDAIDDAVREGLNLRGGSDADMYVNELLKQPVRLLMQVLQDFYTKKYDASSVNNKCDQGNDEGSKELLVPNLLRSALYGSMLSSIYRAGLNYEQHRFGMDSLCKDIFTYVKQDRDFNTGFYLRPQSESEALRNCSIYLASQVSKNCQGSFSKVLQMLLVGCGSVSIFNQFVSRTVQSKDDSEKFEQLVSEYIAYMSVGRNESASHWASRCSAVIADASNDGKVGVFIGQVQLNRGSRKVKQGNYSQFKLDNESGLAKAAMAASLSTVVSNNLMDFSSIFNLIGAISDIAACSSDIPAAPKVFNKIISQPTCIAPPWSNASARAEVKTGKTDDEDENSSQVADEIDHEDNHESGRDYQRVNNEFIDAFDAINTWLELVKDLEPKIRPSALLIGKIWTRFYFNISNIADSHKKRLNDPEAWRGTKAIHSNAAKIMRFNVLALLHAVLVEESLYHAIEDKDYIGDGLRLNPITSVEEFEKKLAHMHSVLSESDKQWHQTNPLFLLLISCPILHPFIFPFGGINSSQKSLGKEETFRDLISKIVESDLFPLDNWGCLIKCDPDDTRVLDKNIKSLSSATIARAKYSSLSQDKREEKSLPKDDAN